MKRCVTPCLTISLTILLWSCHENPKPDLISPAFFYTGNPIIDPAPLIGKSDGHASALVDDAIREHNTFARQRSTLPAQYDYGDWPFDFAKYGTKETNPIVSTNLPTGSTTGAIVYTYSYHLTSGEQANYNDGLTDIAIQCTDVADNYQFEYFVRFSSTWFTMITITDRKDKSWSQFNNYNVLNPVPVRKYATQTVSVASGTKTSEILYYLPDGQSVAGKMVATQKSDKSGTLSYYDNTDTGLQLDMAFTWAANGSGTWLMNDLSNGTSSSGSWN